MELHTKTQIPSVRPYVRGFLFKIGYKFFEVEAKARECIGFLFVCTFAKSDFKREHEMITSYKRLPEIVEATKIFTIFVEPKDKGQR